MRRPFPRFFLLFSLVLLGVCSHCRDAAAQTGSVKRIRLYCRRLDGFTRFPIDSLAILGYHTWAVKVRHPQAFGLALQQALAPRPAPPSRSFGEGSVRLLYVLTYADGRVERVQVDAARTVLWHHQLFLADSAAQVLLLSPLTRKQRLAIAPPPRARSPRHRRPVPE